jgi:hypothetical protein
MVIMRANSEALMRRPSRYTASFYVFVTCVVMCLRIPIVTPDIYAFLNCV